MAPMNAADYTRIDAALPVMVPHLVTHYGNAILLSLYNIQWLVGERRENKTKLSCSESNLGSEPPGCERVYPLGYFCARELFLDLPYVPTSSLQ